MDSTNKTVNTNKGVVSAPSKARGTVTENKDNANKDYPIHHGDEKERFMMAIVTRLNVKMIRKWFLQEKSTLITTIVKEFKHLWESIHHKSTYYVEFDDEELIEKSVKVLNEALFVKKPSYMITEAEAREMKAEQGLDFKVNKDEKRQAELDKSSIQLSYDLLGEIASRTELKRQTVANILKQISPSKFDMFAYNPEAFIQRTSRLINEQKASQVIEHIRYNILEETFDSSIFTDNPLSGKVSDANMLKSEKGVYNYVKVDSGTERKFKEDLERFDDVMVYAKLPSKFKISTPLGDYNPDWAIAFRDGSVKHVYFVAETKGSMSSLQLKGAELAKIECAKAHFKALKEKGLISDDRIYDVVDSYEKLLEIVRG